MFLVVGLGNPGDRYRCTRHNVGFEVARELTQRWGLRPGESMRHGAHVAHGLVRQVPCVAARPQLFMNRSGGPVAALAAELGLQAESIIVVHDDLDLNPGVVRCKQGGGHGGHNGLRDISARLGRDFLRVRVGIGRPPEGQDAAAHVLSPWTAAERALLDAWVARATDAIECVMTDGIGAAMNHFNVRPRSGADTQPDADARERVGSTSEASTPEVLAGGAPLGAPQEQK